jgi:hypothetical protein
MQTTLKVSLLVTLLGTTLAVTTPVIATEEIQEICDLTIIGGGESQHNNCEMLLTIQVQEIQDLLTQSTVVSQDITPSSFMGYWPTTQIIELLTTFCFQLVDIHPNLGMDAVSAQRMCEQGMIWEVGQIIMANSPSGFLSNGAVWANPWPDGFW